MKTAKQKDRVVKFAAGSVQLEVHGNGNVYAPHENDEGDVAVYRTELAAIVTAFDKLGALQKEKEKIENRLEDIDGEINDVIAEAPDSVGTNQHEVLMEPECAKGLKIGCKEATIEEARRLLKVCNAMVARKKKP